MRFQSATAAAVLVAALLASGRTAHAASATGAAPVSSSSALIAAALKSIEAQFPQASRLSPDKVAHAAINGILKEIDPSGSSFSYAAADGQKGKPTPGFLVRLVDGVPTVVSVFVHTDAYYKELAPGDILLKVADLTVVGKTVHDIAKLLEGEAGTSVKLTVYRKSALKFLEVSVKREAVVSAAYARSVGRNVAFVTVNALDSKGVELLRGRLDEALKDKPIGIVLDLRSTAGGTVEDAVAAAGLFLSDVPVVKVQSQGSPPTERSAPKSAPSTVPLVVICDFGTTGAAEIVASALQDDKRAVVIGEKSFGLASAQSAVNLDPQNLLQLTTALYVSPSGREIWAEGVKPDIVMKLELPATDQLVKLRKEFTRFCLGEKAAGKTPETTSAGAAGATTSTTASAAATGETTASEPDEDHPEDEDEAGPDGKPKIKTSDGILEEYKLVKQFDTQLVRAINILISANIFYEYGQRQR
ncbi:MAG: PDZ domain-containing protein [Candidatus Wallbacteria bacterium]|nr:PDZ domain-containing protein [Candidatus Wallbacteria bacterium]